MTSSNSKVIAPAMQSKRSNKRKTTEQFIAEAIAVHGNKYNYYLVEYVNNKVKVKIICPEHGVFEQKPNSHLLGSGCADCAGNTKSNTDSYIAKAKIKHGDKYDYSSSVYKSALELISINCPEHGEFICVANEHIRGSGCGECKKDKIAQDFFSKAKRIHGDKYDYSQSKYISGSKKITIICPIHGAFEQTPNIHSQGCGCQKCAISLSAEKQRKDQRVFVSQAVGRHGDLYDYSNIKYVNSNQNVEIFCKLHGGFEQTPANHLKGKGCPACSYEVLRKTTDTFIEQSIVAHGGKYYDYSETFYDTADSKVKIICPEHGAFEQRAANHLMGQGCKECANLRKGWSRTKYIARCEKKYKSKSNLYVIECYNNTEHFYKIGITAQEVKRRFYGKQMPYEYKVVTLIKFNSGFSWDLERQIHRVLRDFKYRPSVEFRGDTECFSEIPKEVHEFLNRMGRSSQLQLIT